MFGLHLTVVVYEPDDGSPRVHPVARGFRALVLPACCSRASARSFFLQGLAGLGVLAHYNSGAH